MLLPLLLVRTLLPATRIILLSFLMVVSSLLSPRCTKTTLLTSDLDSPFAARQNAAASNSDNSAEFSHGRQFLFSLVVRERLC